MRIFYRKLLPAIVMALLSPPTYAEDLYGLVVPLVGNLGPVIEGEALAIDGDTITIRLQPIRLYGIQALELDPACNDGWTGGGKATPFLSKLIAGQIVTCLVQGQDRDQRPAAICSVGNIDLNEAMVLNGLALADTSSSQAYRRTEQAAKALSAAITNRADAVCRLGAVLVKIHLEGGNQFHPRGDYGLLCQADVTQTRTMSPFSGKANITPTGCDFTS